MDVERKRRALELLDEALDRPAEARVAFLDEACAGDEEMRRHMEALLDTEPAGGILTKPAFSVHAEDAAVGRRIGPYEVVQLLDRGGMGSVYLAKREDLDKQVALKVIRRGLDVDDVLVRRFHNERQILARLEHPHIARFLDGGATEDRLPYFVMEYAEGEPIDRYCESRGLDLEARLDLFRKVCSAVQFAHQNLVIHRDLKPGNVFVNAEGEPKLLDFGIAKLLDEGLAAEPLVTEPGQGPMTPRYASPEQIRLEPVTTASDVYSLGVLLYELLTGVDPYGVESGRGDEVARAICEEEPERPSTAVRRRGTDGAETQRLRRRLAGDLDTIVLKAMRKEPEERYHSVEQLSDDIRRHLQGRPIEAQTGTFTYRAGKFVRRHKLAMAVTVALVLLTSGFSVVSTVLWRRAVTEQAKAVAEQAKAETERARAERAGKRAQAAFDLVIEMFRAADPDQTGGKEISAFEMLQRGKDWILAESAKEEPELQIEVAGILGLVFRNLGAFDDSEEMMRRALDMAREHYEEPHAEIARRINNLAVLLNDGRDLKQAERLFHEALEMRTQLGQSPVKLSVIKSNLGTNLLHQNRLDEAEVFYVDVLRTREEYYDEPDDLRVATARSNLGGLYYAWGRSEAAESLVRQALESRRRASAPERTVASSLDLLGNVLAARGEDVAAERALIDALEIRSRVLGPDHLATAKTQKNLAAVLARRDPDAALALLAQALETFERTRPGGWEIAEATSVKGTVLAAQQLYEEAESHLVYGYERLNLLLPGHFRTRMALDRILDLYEAWDKPEKLQSYRELAEDADAE